LAIAVVVGAGCATTGGVGGYMADRGGDFMDIASCDVGVGYGFEGNAKVTDYFGVGLGSFEGLKIGTVGRTGGIWYQNDYCEYIPGYVAMRMVEMKPVAGTVEAFAGAQRRTCCNWEGDPESVEDAARGLFKDKPETISPETDRGKYDIGGHGSLIFIDGGFTFRPLELWDFVVGLFGSDFQGDDSAGTANGTQ